MAKFTNIVPCPPEDTSFFSNMRPEAASYSCTWDTKTRPDDDFEDSRAVYEQVLASCDISIDNAAGDRPPRGTLPGMDINRMGAIDAINLSLAEALLDRQWWEIVEDNFGGVFFQKVYDDGSPGKTITLSPRLCIPSTEKKNNIDMVAVTGYDTPPERYVRDFKHVVQKDHNPVNPLDIPAGQFTVDFADMVGESCHKFLLRTEAVKVYVDPLIEQSIFGTPVRNPFYDVKAFESIKGWAIRVKGMPEGNTEAAKVKFEFNPKSTWHYRYPDDLEFEKIEDVSVAEFACAGGQTTQGGAVTYFQSEIRIDNKNVIDKYGDTWPLLIRPNVITFMGYKIDSFVDFSAFPGGKIFVFVEPKAQFQRATEGSDWVFELDGDTDQFVIKPYYQPKVDADWWDYILKAIGGQDVQFEFTNYKRGWNTFGNDEAPGEDSDQQFDQHVKGIIQNNTKLGFLVTDYWIGFEIDRPSVVVTTKDGSPARDYSDPLEVEYAPIIIRDTPPEFAYKYREEPFGEGIVVKVTAEEMGETLPDADPTTCQNFELTPANIMQDRMQGNVVNITLPFCVDADACATVAETIFDYQTEPGANTVTLTCGPDDEPELGAAVTGYEANLRIESINYSYNDGSSYTIEVTLGSIFSNIGSWNTTTWAPKVSSATRKGKIVFTGGDSVNYRVDVQGLGTYNAINSSTNVWNLGEIVDVTVYNLPQEA